MAIIRWEPARRGGELHSLQREFNRLFGTVFDSQTGVAAPARRWVPAVDLVEQDSSYVLRADLPGLSEDDVKIEVSDHVLTVSGERSAQHEERKDGYYRLERSSGSFSRSVRLPQGVQPDAIEASFANGVLEVRIPKPEQPQPQRVEIKPAAQAEPVEAAEATESEAAEAAEPAEQA